MEYVLIYVVVVVGLCGGVGYLIGDSKGLARQGFWFGALLGFIGWIIVALMEPSHQERQRRQAEIATAVVGVVGISGPIAPAERPCPFCAELIKPAAIVCRFCGRDVPRLSPPLSAPPQPQVAHAGVAPDSSTLLDRIQVAYPTVARAVWEAAKSVPWPPNPEAALRDACERVMHGTSADAAVRRAFGSAGGGSFSSF